MNPIFMNMLLWSTHITVKEHGSVIKGLKEAGFDGVEIPVLEGDEAEYEELKGLLADEVLGVSAVGVAGDPTSDHTSSNLEIQIKGVDALKRQVDRARALEAEKLGGPYQLIWGWRPTAPANPDTFFQIEEVW